MDTIAPGASRDPTEDGSNRVTLVRESLRARSWVPKTPARRVIFTIAVLYALVQLSRGVYLALSPEVNDITRIRGFFWSILDRNPVPSPYPPHVYLLLAPLLLLPLPLTEIAMFLLNLSLIYFVWRRVSEVLSLTPENRAWFLVLFLCWVSVRVTLSHGQLGLIALGGAVWAWTSLRSGWLGLVVSTVKVSLSFPVLLDRLFRKPRSLIPTISLGIVGVGLFLFWTDMPTAEYPSYLADGLSRDVTGFGVDVVSALSRSLGAGAWIQILVGGLWLVAFVLIRKRMRQLTIGLLAALLALSLLPVYHRFYDIVVLAPALAVFLSARPLGYSLLMTAALAGADTAIGKRGYLGMEWVEPIARWYLPLVVLVVVAALVPIRRPTGPLADHVANTEGDDAK